MSDVKQGLLSAVKLYSLPHRHDPSRTEIRTPVGDYFEAIHDHGSLVDGDQSSDAPHPTRGRPSRLAQNRQQRRFATRARFEVLRVEILVLKWNPLHELFHELLRDGA